MRFSLALAIAAVASTAAQQAARPVPGATQGTLDGFAARSYRSGRDTMPYRLFVPSGYDGQKKYPLIVWLHGAGGVGRDNLRQIAGDQIAGTRTWTQPATQAKYPAFVVAPQTADGWGAQTRGPDALGAPLTLVVGIVDSLENEFSIDRHRIYVAGQSDGGFAVWDLITKQPERVAAAIAVCGGGDPARAARVRTMPIWVFHGDADDVVPVTASRQMVAAINKAGGHPRYTEYKGAGHDVWKRAFAEPGLIDWLFAQTN
ncbi:MAG TPA: PHB depolymerase family esterase [Vicinamibacterales bacterium]|nr:PHB depolymerase family esterase [Vicinamibacterales bacterium]